MLTVVGDGFDGDSIQSVSVSIFASYCVPISISRTRIVCVTSRAWGEGVGDATVSLVKTDGTILSSVCAYNCSFHFTDLLTPLMTSLLPTAIHSTDATLTIYGANFGVSVADVSVTIGDVNVTVMTVTNDTVVCAVDDVVAGSQPVSLTVQPGGRAVDTVITVNPGGCSRVLFTCSRV